MALDPYKIFPQYVAMIGQDAERLRQWIDGPAGETVETESGPIPTWAGMRQQLGDINSLEVSVTDTQSPRTLESIAKDFLSPKNFGAISDGTLHTAQEWIIPGALGRFSSLEGLQSEYPFVESLEESIDYIAFQAMLNYAEENKQKFGYYLSGKNVFNRESIIRCPIHIITDGVGEIVEDWRQRGDKKPDSGTYIIGVGDFSICQTVKTRRRWRGALSDPHDEAFSCLINIQSPGVRLGPITYMCDYDVDSIINDPMSTIPSVSPTFNTDGEPIAPGYYGAPEVRVPTYWGANIDVAVFSGCRVDVDISGSQFVGGFRKGGFYCSGADSSLLPPLLDWRGNPYPSLEISGCDQFKAVGVKGFGAPYSIMALGAEPRPGLSKYGKYYNSRLLLSFSGQPLDGDQIDLAGTVYEFKAQDENGNWPAASPGTRKARVMPEGVAETIYQFVKQLELDIDAVSDDNSDSLRLAWPGQWEDNELIFTSKSEGESPFVTFFTASTTSGIISIENGGVVVDGLGDLAPYCWADESTPQALLEEYSQPDVNGVSYADGFYRDDRTTVGMSDMQISEVSFRGLRRGDGQLGQIRLDRDQTRDDRGADIWIDGISGNGSRRIQKLWIGPGKRLGYSGMATALKLGRVNLVFIKDLVSDENPGTVNYLVPTTNVYGWYAESVRKGVTTIDATSLPGDSSPSTRLSPFYEYRNVRAFGIGERGTGNKGEWAPRIVGATLEGEHEYAVQEGRWEISGDMIYLHFRVQISAVDPACEGALEIAGMPFTPQLEGSLIASMPVGYARDITAPSGGVALVFQMSEGAVTLVSQNISGGNFSISTLTESALTNSSQIRGTIVYPIA